MKIRPQAFKEDPLYGYMEKLSLLLNSPVTNNNTIELSPNNGSGFIKSIFLEDDFCIRYYHFSFNEPTPFHWFFNSESDEPIYKLLFTCSPTLTGLDKTSSFNDPHCLTDDSVMLYSEDSETMQIIPANKMVIRIALIFTKAWLEDNFLDASSKISETLQQLTESNRPSFIPELMGYSYYSVVREIAKEMDKDIFPFIHIKTKSLYLLNEFLDKVVKTDEERPFEQKSLYHDVIILVEQRLQEYLLTHMPSIALLSAEFNMSASTLQRHFKIVYGKNIYQYYLEQKLAVCKELIASRRKTISEVAYMLGYNKINSFSKVFKKYFGVLPKDINSIKKYG